MSGFIYLFLNFFKEIPALLCSLAACNHSSLCCTGCTRTLQGPAGHSRMPTQLQGADDQLLACAGKGAKVLDAHAPGPAPQPLGPHGHTARIAENKLVSSFHEVDLSLKIN